MIEATIPIKSVSVANLRMHWAVKAKLAKAHRNAAKTALMSVAPEAPELPLTVILTRLGPRTLDTDNLASCLKAVRDGVADWLGVDDGDARLDWQYEQRKGPYSVEVEII
jgi:crossover junction endodeoxyribonuclease RusA